VNRGFLLNLCLSVFSCIEKDVVSDFVVILSVCRAGCAAKHPDGQTGITSGGISDLIELLVGNNVAFKPHFVRARRIS